jgi:very-short-patch-repair endonuclease
MRTLHKSRYAVPGLTVNQTFALVMKQNGIPPCHTEYRFDPKRRWRFDFCFCGECGQCPSGARVAIELEGGTFIRGGMGAHNRGMAYSRDAEKRNEASLQGWIVLRFTIDMLERNQDYVFSSIRRALALRHERP